MSAGWLTREFDGRQRKRVLVQARFDDVRVEDTAERYVVVWRRVPTMNADGGLPQHRFDKSFAFQYNL